MIVRCPKCNREYNIELSDAVMELNFTCPNCGMEFKVRNTGMTDVEKHNEKYAPRTTQRQLRMLQMQFKSQTRRMMICSGI